MELDVDTFLVTVYCMVDDLYQAEFAPQKPPRPGRKPQVTDSEVLTLAVLAQWQQDRSERRFLRYVRQHWRRYFPRQLSQSAFNRRARDLMGVLAQLGPAVSRETVRTLGQGPPYEVLDTVPVPLMRRCRGQRHRLFGQEAAIGYGGSDRDWYYGVSLLAAVTPQGQITGFVAGPANTEARWLAETLFRWRQDPTHPAPQAQELAAVLGPPHRGPRQGPTGPVAPRGGVGAPQAGIYLGDRGFAGSRWHQHWQEAYGAHVLTAREVAPAARPWLASLRQVVEQVFGCLDALFGLKYSRARTHWGLITRLAAKVSAYALLVHLNYLYDLPPLAHWSPFD
jgi:hypothetical protein